VSSLRRSETPCVVAAVVLSALLIQPSWSGDGALAAQASVDPTVRVTTGALSLNVGGRLHTQFNTTSVEGEPRSELFLRRARIELAVEVGHRVSGTIQPEFGNDRVGLRDAYVDFALTRELTLRTGKAYRPFGLLEQTSSKRILPVERGLRTRGVDGMDTYAVMNALAYSDRDVGVQLVTRLPADLGVTAGVFRGPLHGAVGPHASYQYAARLTHRANSNVRLGAGWSSRDFERTSGGTLGTERGHAFEVDMEYGTFAPGLHVLAELSLGDANPVTESRFLGGQAWIAYRSEPFGDAGAMIEPLLRFSHADISVDGAPATQRGGTLVTPGVALYLGPLNRIAVNYDVWFGQGATDDARSLKVMFQLGF